MGYELGRVRRSRHDAPPFLSPSRDKCRNGIFVKVKSPLRRTEWVSDSNLSPEKKLCARHSAVTNLRPADAPGFNSKALLRPVRQSKIDASRPAIAAPGRFSDGPIRNSFYGGTLVQ
jgi:hypothetical protein